MTHSLSTGVRVGYSMGSLAAGAFGTVPGLLLLPYLTDSLGVTAALAGLLVLGPKAWDVVINPFVGQISDRTDSRWGARRPYVLAGGLLLAVLFALMFAAPFGSGSGSAAFVAVSFILAATAFAFFQVPFVAMPAEITDSYQERTRLMTWRVAILAVAILVSGAAAPAVVNLGGGGISGHRWMGLFVACLIVIGTVGVFLGTRGSPTGIVAGTGTSFRDQIRVARRNLPFMILLTVYVTQSIGVATMLAGVKYMADQVLHRPDDGPTLLFACFVGPALLVMPLWSKLGRRLGKHRSLILASVLMAVGSLSLVIAAAGPPVLSYLLGAVIGVGYAGQQVFALAMLPDCIAYDDARTGRRHAGVFTGLWTAGETLGMALGPGVFALVLSLSGYVSSSTGLAAEQPDTVRWGVLIGFALIPALLIGPVAAVLRRYDLGPGKLADTPRTHRHRPIV